MDLPTDVVRPAPDNLRKRVGDVSGIVASIPTHGIIEPLVVAPQDDGTYLSSPATVATPPPSKRP